MNREVPGAKLMTTTDERFYLFQQRMIEAGLPDLFIETFAYYYHQLLSGQTGLVAEADIEPIDSPTRMLDLAERLRSAGESVSRRTAIIKLNGGLGTSMGLENAKSLLVVKDGYSFLDIIAEQSINAQVPLVLMNSFATEADSREVLSRHPDLISDIPQTFVQHMEPKVRQSDFLPVDWPQEPELTWCPPGHGDIYTALVTKGVLKELLQAGYKYAFFSNADNLGATLDLLLLGHFAENDLPFMIEVAERTENDRKGGHLARRRADGRLILRELAQCPPDDIDAFQDIERHSYFNTNNLWINLESLDRALREHDYILKLPMIRNSKTVDPRDRDSTPVYQLETAMGAAVEIFEGAEAIVVPRSRFAPVKKTSDLLILRSDVYELGDDFLVTLHPDREGRLPVVDLDPLYYQFVSDFDERFAQGVPSLLQCSSFQVNGDFNFGRDVVLQGDVELLNHDETQKTIDDGSVLSG
ncbi:MAG: UTP--glucose-1-phosphate uridylyltransferase [Candidatus Promineifilaceae bacterium]